MPAPDTRATGERGARDADAVLHDVKNCLTTISSLVARVRGSLLEGAIGDRAGLLEDSSRLDALVVETLALSRGILLHPGESLLDAAAYVLEHGIALAGLMGPGQRFSLGLLPERSRCLLRLDPTDLLRVLVNLVSNAAEASEPDGLVELRVGFVHALEPWAMADGLVPPGAYVSLQVLDRGPGPFALQPQAHGLDSPLRPRLAPGERGLGLRVVAELVADAGGGVRVKARNGGGSVVEVLLPRIAPQR